MMKRLFRFLLKIEVVVLAALAGTLAGCPVAKYGPGPVAKYGPGPVNDCTAYASTIAAFLATPATIQVGNQVVFTLALDRAAGEQVSTVRLTLTAPSGGSVGGDRNMADDGTGGDAVANDGTFTEVVSDGIGYPFQQTGNYEATAEVSLQGDDELVYCVRSATTEVDVQ